MWPKKSLRQVLCCISLDHFSMWDKSRTFEGRSRLQRLVSLQVPGHIITFLSSEKGWQDILHQTRPNFSLKILLKLCAGTFEWPLCLATKVIKGQKSARLKFQVFKINAILFIQNVQCVHFFANIFQSLNNFLYLCFCFGSLWGRLMALSANEKIWPQFSGRISTAAPTLLSPSSSSWPPSPSPSSSSPWWASYPLFADISRPLCNSWGDFTDSTSRSTNLSYLSSSSSSYFHFGKSPKWK